MRLYSLHPRCHAEDIESGEETRRDVWSGGRRWWPRQDGGEDRYQLFAVGETSARLQSAASAKEEGDEASAAKALEQEARQVVAEVKRNRN